MNDELERFKLYRTKTNLIVLSLAIIEALFVWEHTNVPIALATFALVLLVYVAQGFRNFDPLTLGVPEFRGELFDCTIGPGWEFIPLSSLPSPISLFSYRVIDAQRKNLELKVQERTPDRGGVEVEPFFTWQVSRQHPKRFIMAGGMDLAVKMFSERVQSRLREWITSPLEGPQTWPDALKSNGPALYVLIQKLFPNSIPPIPEDIFLRAPGLKDIHHVVFVRYFNGNPPLSKDKRSDAEKAAGRPDTRSDLEKQEGEWQVILDNLKNVDPPTWDDLRRAVASQLAFVNNVKNGSFDGEGKLISFPIQDLGIDILLANIAGIKPVGKTGDAADKVAEAAQEALVNNIGAQNLREEIERTLPLVGNDSKLAKELVELRRKLITKNVGEQQYGLSPEMTTAVNDFLKWLIERKAA